MKSDVPLRDRCKGRWREILPALGVSSAILIAKHQPCPINGCGGTDRFRWTDHDGGGGYICSQCQSGDGFSLAMGVLGVDFKEVATRIEGIIGTLPPPSAQRPKLSSDQLQKMMIETWRASQRVTYGDPVERYLSARGIDLKIYPDCLRYHPDLRYAAGVSYPAMLARVTGPDGESSNLHRTYLDRDGAGKAPEAVPRKMMAGSVPHGSAIRLIAHSPAMGVAEGIENALSAAILWNMPVWSCIDAGKMMGWSPPDGVETVYIFGDCDANFTGQSAAYALANRLYIKNKIKVVVQIPEDEGDDINDMLRKG